MSCLTCGGVNGKHAPGCGENQCNTLFCVLDKHADNWHMDAVGETWQEPLSELPVIARAYSWVES